MNKNFEIKSSKLALAAVMCCITIFAVCSMCLFNMAHATGDASNNQATSSKFFVNDETLGKFDLTVSMYDETTGETTYEDYPNQTNWVDSQIQYLDTSEYYIYWIGGDGSICSEYYGWEHILYSNSAKPKALGEGAFSHYEYNGQVIKPGSTYVLQPNAANDFEIVFTQNAKANISSDHLQDHKTFSGTRTIDGVTTQFDSKSLSETLPNGTKMYVDGNTLRFDNGSEYSLTCNAIGIDGVNFKKWQLNGKDFNNTAASPEIAESGSNYTFKALYDIKRDTSSNVSIDVPKGYEDYAKFDVNISQYDPNTGETYYSVEKDLTSYNDPNIKYMYTGLGFHHICHTNKGVIYTDYTGWEENEFVNGFTPKSYHENLEFDHYELNGEIVEDEKIYNLVDKACNDITLVYSEIPRNTNIVGDDISGHKDFTQIKIEGENEPVVTTEKKISFDLVDGDTIWLDENNHLIANEKGTQSSNAEIVRDVQANANDGYELQSWQINGETFAASKDDPYVFDSAKDLPLIQPVYSKVEVPSEPENNDSASQFNNPVSQSPSTGDIALATVVVFAAAALGISLYYYKKKIRG